MDPPPFEDDEPDPPVEDDEVEQLVVVRSHSGMRVNGWC